MDATHLQSAIAYLENNDQEHAEIILDSGVVYTTRYMKLMDDVAYITTDHINGKDVAVVPCSAINHVLIKNSQIEKVMGFAK
jgi:hypothetical protein